MLTTIHITVRDRVPTITAGEDVISHNSDYVAEFEFDEEWQDKVKTVYFVCEDGSYQAVVMSGNSCGVPMMAGEHRRIFVGVQAGAAEKPSVLKTTRPCCLKVKDSIADYLGQPIPDPTPDVYQQIMAMLNNLTAPPWDSVQNKPFSTLGSGLSVDENGVLSAQGGGGSANAVQYVAQSLTDEQKAQARSNIGASPIPTVRYWLKLNADNIINLYNMGVGYGIISPVDTDQTVPTGMSSPMLVIFGRMNYGRVDITVYDGAGAVWRGSLNLSSQTTDVTKTGDYVTNTALTDILQNYVSAEEWEDFLQQTGQVLNQKLDKNQGVGNAGKILGIGADGNVTPQDKPTYTLPQATADALGGIKADAATAEDTQVVRIGADGKLRTKPTGGSSITVDSELSSTSENPVQNKVVTAALAEKITAPTTAAVGQILKVKSVDTSGKPTEWECADLPSGGGEITTHGIIWDLVNVTSSNNAVSVADGAPLVAVLTAADGYTLGDVTITMGGEVVTGAWNADTATVTITSVTGDVVISCVGVGDVQIIPVFSYGNIKSETGIADTSAARQHSELINCMTKGLRIDVPATSDYYSATTGATKITYSVFAYDADGNYISGVDSSGKVLESAATFGGWLTCNYGESIYLPSGYQYVFVNSNSVSPKPFDSNSKALAFCNSGELKFYLINGGDSGGSTTTNEESSVMMLSFNRAYVDTGEYTEDLLPKWDGMFSIHRGYSTAPNNTLQAIWEAKKHGYNCCELDVRYTSDNQVVLNHDATVTGTVDGVEVTYTIAGTPLATLQTVCIGNTAFPDAKVCSLEDAMRLCRRIGMRPEIDYKVSNEQLYKDCVALSMKYGLQDDTLHCCYGMSYALAVKTEYEKANLRVDGTLLDSDTSLDAYLTKPGNLYAFYSAAACGKTDGSNVGANVDNETRILTHKAKGYKMYVWNVTPNLLPDVMQWEPDILQPQSSKDTSDWYTLIRELNSFDGLIW